MRAAQIGLLACLLMACTGDSDPPPADRHLIIREGSPEPTIVIPGKPLPF
jgi:hypothetical protein